MNPEKKVTLQCMLDELEGGGLLVLLAPAPQQRHTGHCVRVVADENPEWYRALCAAHLSSRRRRNPRPDTLIRRRHTLRSLRKMIAGEQAGPRYGERLLEAARRYYRKHRADIRARIEAETAA